LRFSAIVFVTLREGDKSAVSTFESAVTGVPQVIQLSDCSATLTTCSTSSAPFQRLYDERLSALPGVQRLTSTLVMKDVVRDRPLPL
jgi:hypothetical protein